MCPHGASQTDEEFGRDHGLIHEVVVTGRKVGAGRDFWSKLAQDPALFERTVRFVSHGGLDRVEIELRAREIMGKNFFGIEEALDTFLFKLPARELAPLSEIPFSEEILLACKDTHILVAVLPLSILQIRSQLNTKFFFSHDGAWYNNAGFAEERGQAGWHLISKLPVADSTAKTWYQQQPLLSACEMVPSARIMVYSIISHHAASGERLFPSVRVRCSTEDLPCGHVSVGRFNDNGLLIEYDLDSLSNNSLGLVTARQAA